MTIVILIDYHFNLINYNNNIDVVNKIYDRIDTVNSNKIIDL
jgi:hypothetical protein